MKLGMPDFPPAVRVVFFIAGVVSALGTLQHISRGYTRYGGVLNTRADDPFAYWSVVATITYLTALLFCAALVKKKTKN